MAGSNGESSRKSIVAGVRFDIENTVTGHRSNIIENTGSPLERCLSNRRVRESRIYATARMEWHTSRYESLT